MIHSKFSTRIYSYLILSGIAKYFVLTFAVFDVTFNKNLVQRNFELTLFINLAK